MDDASSSLQVESVSECMPTVEVFVAVPLGFLVNLIIVLRHLINICLPSKHVAVDQVVKWMNKGVELILSPIY